MTLVYTLRWTPRLRELDAALVIRREQSSGTYSEMPQIVGVKVTGMLCRFVNIARRAKFSLMQPNDRFHISFEECFRPTDSLIIKKGKYLKKFLVNFR